jgi:hypothetical protein
MKLLIMHFVQPPVTSFLFGSNTLGTLFSKTPNPCSFLNARDRGYAYTERIKVGPLLSGGLTKPHCKKISLLRNAALLSVSLKCRRSSAEIHFASAAIVKALRYCREFGGDTKDTCVKRDI